MIDVSADRDQISERASNTDKQKPSKCVCHFTTGLVPRLIHTRGTTGEFTSLPMYSACVGIL